MHKSRDKQNLFCTFESQGNAGFFLNYVTVFACFLQVQNMPLCLERLVRRSHECKVVTDPLSLSALTLPTCMQCIPILLTLISHCTLLISANLISRL